MPPREIAVIYSGGTDSTCVAALLAERYDRVHLLTFEELGTRGAPNPVGNVKKLKARFGEDKFVHHLLGIDDLLRKISYDRYLSYLWRHGLFMLSTCGFSSLSWHVRTILYCLDHEIMKAADGVTRELMHFPGHMDGVLEEVRRLYAHFGIEYANPVRDWDTPPDRQFVDRLIVDRHYDFPEVLDRLAEGVRRSGGRTSGSRRTTGWYLYEKGLLPHPDVKGTELDRSMQHACYPFVLFNIFVFWYYLSWHGYSDYENRMKSLFRDKVDDAKRWIEECRRRGEAGALGAPVEAA